MTLSRTALLEDPLGPKKEKMLSTLQTFTRPRRRYLGMITAIVATVAFGPFVTVNAAGEPQAVMKTVGGVLKVVAEPFPTHLMLNKSKVPGIEDDFIELKQKFNVAGNDVVLVRNQCAGSSCGYSTLTFLTITSAGKVTVSEGMDADEDGTAEIKVVGETLVIKTETFQGRRKKTSMWTYANGKVAKSK